MVASSVSPERWLITARVAGAVRHLHRLQRLGQRADLVDLHQDRVGDALARCRARSRSGLVTNRSSPTSCTLRAERCRSAASSRPSRPRRSRPRSRRSGSAGAELGEVVDHAGGIERLALAFQVVLAVLEELGRGAVEREGRRPRPAGSRPSRRRLAMKASASSADFEVGREAALVADIGVVAGVVQRLLQRVEDLGAHAHRVGEACRRRPA